VFLSRCAVFFLRLSASAKRHKPLDLSGHDISNENGFFQKLLLPGRWLVKFLAPLCRQQFGDVAVGRPFDSLVERGQGGIVKPVASVRNVIAEGHLGGSDGCHGFCVGPSKRIHGLRFLVEVEREVHVFGRLATLPVTDIVPVIAVVIVKVQTSAGSGFRILLRSASKR